MGTKSLLWLLRGVSQWSALSSTVDEFNVVSSVLFCCVCVYKSSLHLVLHIAAQPLLLRRSLGWVVDKGESTQTFVIA